MKVPKEIFRLAIPNILSNISVPLIASVDTGLMGYLSANHLAAVGSSAMIFNFLYWNFGFLRMGTTGMVAQAYGKKDNYEKSRVFLQACLLALLISATIIIFQVPLSNMAFSLMNLDTVLEPLASDYFFTRVWDAPATLLLYILMAWFFGNQNAFIPLLLTIIINISNISLSFYFVRVLDMGISGVALGSVIANYIGVISGFALVFGRYPIIWIKLSEVIRNLQRFYQVNSDIFLRTLMLSITFAFLYSKAAGFGTTILAVNVIILQFTNWMSYAVDGFAYASEALVGKYTGSKEAPKVMETIKYSMLYGLIFALLFSIAYGLFPIKIASLFTNDESVLTAISDYYLWIFIYPVVGFASYIWDGVFVGLTASKTMRNTMFISFVVFLATYYLAAPIYNYHGLLLALCLYLLSRGIAQTVAFSRKGLKLN